MVQEGESLVYQTRPILIHCFKQLGLAKDDILRVANWSDFNRDPG